MIGLIKTIFDQIVLGNWLRTIRKAVEKWERIKRELDVQMHVVNKLLDRYKEVYGEDLRG